jgi:hypothetical protein
MPTLFGLDVHAASTTFAVIGESGKRLGAHVVETNGQALVEQLKSIPGKRHVCLEEGTQSAWIYEILSPHAEEVVVAMVPDRKGQKSDESDAFHSRCAVSSETPSTPCPSCAARRLGEALAADLCDRRPPVRALRWPPAPAGRDHRQGNRAEDPRPSRPPRRARRLPQARLRSRLVDRPAGRVLVTRPASTGR